MADTPKLPQYWSERLARCERTIGAAHFDNIYLRQDIANLKAQIAIYGRHTAECISDPEYPGRWKCDCGWAEIEKGLEVKE